MKGVNDISICYTNVVLSRLKALEIQVQKATHPLAACDKAPTVMIILYDILALITSRYVRVLMNSDLVFKYESIETNERR